MSLINDALRKARQAASEHEARQPDSAFRPPVSYPSRGPHRRSGAIRLVLVAMTAALVGGFLAWWLLGGGDPAAEPPSAAVVENPVIEVQPAETPVIGESESEATAHTAPTTPVPSTASVGIAEQFVESAVDEPPAVQVRPTADQPASHPSASGPRVFVLDADLGYAKLSLGYIVARSTNPFAEINGDDLYVGSEVEGFVVEAIEADRVILRDDRGELILKVP